MPKVDENSEYVSLAYDGTNAVPLKIDPVTGRLLVYVIIDNATPTLNNPKIDENNESVSLAVNENSSIKPLLTDTNSNLLIDLKQA